MQTLNSLSLKISAAAVAFVLANTGAAQAQTLKDTVTNINEQISVIPSLIATVAYVGGAAMGLMGVYKLKQHVDNPQNTPMKDGLVRLGAGGALLALPWLLTTMQGSMSGGGAGSFSGAPKL